MRRYETLHRAGRRYQRSAAGALRHALRQQAWRARRQARVTHHALRAVPESSMVAPITSGATLAVAPRQEDIDDQVDHAGESDTGDDLAPSSFDDSYTPLTLKTCVGTKTSDTPIGFGSGDGYMAVDTGVYDRVVLLDPATTSRVIDVYIDDKLYRRVRW